MHIGLYHRRFVKIFLKITALSCPNNNNEEHQVEPAHT